MFRHFQISFLYYSPLLWCLLLLLLLSSAPLCRDNVLFLRDVEILFVKSSIVFSSPAVYKTHWNCVLRAWISIVQCWLQDRKQSQNVLLIHVIWPERERDGETKTLLQIWKSNWVLIQRCAETKGEVAWRPKIKANTQDTHTHTHTHTHTGVITGF